jgi:IS1 family transposase
MRKVRAKMNCLSKEKKILVLSCLVEGNSIRSTERITGVQKKTILRLLKTIAKKCEKFSDQIISNIHTRYVQVDEIWTFVQKKQKRLTLNEEEIGEFGDQYVFIGIDAETKLAVSYVVGKREGRTAYLFMQNLSKRVAGRFQLTTDAFKAYVDAVDMTWGCNVDYAQLKKLYNGNGAGREGYSPSDINGTVPIPITGKPKAEHVSTSYVERQNLTIRMGMRRFTRLTNGFSKKVRNLEWALALHFFYYNFLRVHETLRITPAMEAGIADHIWTWGEFLAKN